MADPRLVSEWLEKAEEDFGFAISIIEDSTFYAQICFHFHQAAEKHLKTYMIARDMEFKRIHDLPVLLKSCSAIEPNLQVLQDDCRFLNRFYIDTRYPVHSPANYSKEEALKAKKAAEHIRDAIRNALKLFYPSIP
jgi:HEPN domain-containing protein